MKSTGLFHSVEFFGKNLSGKEKSLVYQQIMLYLFRGTNQTKIRKFLLENQINFDFPGWKATISRNGTLLVNCKLFVYAHLNGRKEKLEGITLSDEDKRACKLACANNELQSISMSLYQKDKYAALSNQDFDRVISSLFLCADLKSYMKSFIYTKLRFLCNSYGFSSSDLESDLTSYALIALYKAYPRYGTLGQMLAIAKSAMHNRGINIIAENTAQRNNRMTGGPGSAELNTFSLDFDDNAHDTLLASDSSGSLVVGEATTTEWEESSAIKIISASKAFDASEREFICVMMGKPSKAFSQYLGVDNSTIIETMSTDKYRRKAESFFCVENSKALLDSAYRVVYN